jgi:hypothetical protein
MAYTISTVVVEISADRARTVNSAVPNKVEDAREDPAQLDSGPELARGGSLRPRFQ